MNTLVIGAGIVGLAVARALALRGHEVIVVEKTDGIGSGVSSRNSEVIHAGMYYPAGRCAPATASPGGGCSTPSARATGCRTANAASSSWHERPRTAKIEGIYERARERVEGCLSAGAEARRSSPARPARAVLSPRPASWTASLMLALQGDLEAAGGMIAFHAPWSGSLEARPGM
jgi:glycine/D-amino acid oxidase-like deaminating enzyme